MFNSAANDNKGMVTHLSSMGLPEVDELIRARLGLINLYIQGQKVVNETNGFEHMPVITALKTAIILIDYMLDDDPLAG